MRYSEKTGEIPDHFIFFDTFSLNETPEKAQELEYLFTNRITHQFVMGPIFYIESLERVHVVCIPCHNGNHLIFLVTKSSKFANIWKSMYANLHGAYIDTDRLWDEEYIAIAKCDGFANQKKTYSEYVNTRNHTLICV